MFGFAAVDLLNHPGPQVAGEHLRALAAYIRGNIWRTLKHPTMVRVKTWAVAQSHLEWETSWIDPCCSARSLSGPATIAGHSIAAPIRAHRPFRSRRAPKRHHRRPNWDAALSRAWPC